MFFCPYYVFKDQEAFKRFFQNFLKLDSFCNFSKLLFAFISNVGCWMMNSVTSKKSPNVYESCSKMISREKLKILTP